MGLAFVRRGWVDTLLRLGCSSDANFLEPEVAFCLHGLANSGGVMEAVCRSQVIGSRVSAVGGVGGAGKGGSWVDVCGVFRGTLGSIGLWQGWCFRDVPFVAAGHLGLCSPARGLPWL